MIFEFFLRCVVNLVSTIFRVVLPVLPPAFVSMFPQVFRWIQSGVGFVWLFVDRAYVSQLAQWWITVCGTLLTVELAIAVWRAVTGNFGGHDARKGE